MLLQFYNRSKSLPRLQEFRISGSGFISPQASLPPSDTGCPMTKSIAASGGSQQYRVSSDKEYCCCYSVRSTDSDRRAGQGSTINQFRSEPEARPVKDPDIRRMLHPSGVKTAPLDLQAMGRSTRSDVVRTTWEHTLVRQRPAVRKLQVGEADCRHEMKKNN